MGKKRLLFWVSGGILLLVLWAILKVFPSYGTSKPEVEKEKGERFSEFLNHPIMDPIRWPGRFYTLQGTSQSGETIQVFWEVYRHPQCPKPPCYDFGNLTEVEIETEGGKVDHLPWWRGWFLLHLPEKPGVYAFPVTFHSFGVHSKTKERKFWKDEVDVVYYVAPPGATCKYIHWKPSVHSIPHRIKSLQTFWEVELDASKLLDRILPAVQCSDKKIYPFRGTFKYIKGRWKLRREIQENGTLRWRDWVPPEEFSTAGLFYADLQRRAVFHAEIKEPGRYIASFCLLWSPLLEKDEAGEGLPVELLNSSPFTFADRLVGCASQEIVLPPAE